MANTTIPNLPAATSLDGNEQLEVVQNGTSKRVTADQIAALAENTSGTVTQIDTGGALVGGPITTTGTISLPPDAVTNVYLAEMPANTLKANITGLTANPTDVTPSQLLDTFSSAEGAMLYRGVSGWQELAPGSNNQYMYTNGNNPQWVTLAINPGDIGPSGVTPGSYGSPSETITFTVISGGLLTTAAAVPIAISTSQITGLGTMATQNANNVAITGGNVNGTIIGASTPAQAYFTTISGGAWEGTPISVAYGGTGATTAAGARTNLGLGTMATQNANSVAITGGSINNTSIGALTPQSGAFTTLSASSTSSFGTITSGTWNGSAIGVAYGGTGATDATTARTNLGAAASGANSDITSLTGLTTPLSAPQGGTGFSSYTVGDLVYAPTSSSLGRLNDVATGNALLSGGVGVAPFYGKVGLTTHITGTLPVDNGGTGATSLTGYVKGNGTSAFTAVTAIPNSDLQNSSVTIGSTTIALGGSTSALAGLTTVTLTQDPSAALEASTKQYVDNQVSAVSNLTYHTQVTSATTANLNATYNNGVGGVGATLTNAGAFAQFQIDSYTPGSLARVLVKNQTNAYENGIYEVTTQGDGVSVLWVLTRTSDFNTVGSGPTRIQTGASVFVQFGTNNGSTSWVMNTTPPITVGSTNLNWTQTSSSGNILVDAPLIKTGNTLSLGTVNVPFGGTGITSYTIGDLLYADSSTSLAKLADVATGNVLRSGGVGVAPAWGKVDLTTDVSGTLPVANGGSGTSTAFTQGSVLFAGASGVYSQNNSKFFWNNTDFRLGLNTASPTTVLTILSPTQTSLPPGVLPSGTDIHIVGANNAETRITQDSFGTGNYPVYTGRAARGTAASPTALQSGDILTQYTGRGYGATGYNSASTGVFEFIAAENFSDTAQGTYASVRLTATGGASPAEVFRIGPVGQVGVGGSNYGTASQLLISGGASAAPQWTDASTISVGTATNLAGGAAGSVPYQSGASTTTFLGIGAANTVLTSSGTAPQWSTSLTLAGSVSTTAATITTGNLAFTGTAQRITGDMSNATVASRVMFQSSTTNGQTSVGLIPNGTSTTSQINFETSSTDVTNASYLQVRNTGSESGFDSNKRGTGSYLPMTFYTGGSERVRIDTSGNVGIGGTADAYAKIHVLGTLPTSATFTNGIRISGTIPSGTTGGCSVFQSAPTTQAASFTLASLVHFSAQSQVFGAGSVITSQYGFVADSSLTGATNNYGFFSNIASSAGRWNFYANGTAANYFAGNVGIATTSPGSALDVKGTLRLSGSTSGYVGLSPAAAAGSTTYTLPSADGTTGQFLSTNGSGTLSWSSAGGGAQDYIVQSYGVV